MSKLWTYEGTRARLQTTKEKTRNGGYLLSDGRILAYCPVCDVGRASIKLSRINRFNRKHHRH